MTSAIPADSEDPASVTPDPSIHDLPPDDSSSPTSTPPAVLSEFQEWGQTLLTQVGNAIVMALTNVVTDIEKPFEALATFGEEVLDGSAEGTAALSDWTTLFEGLGDSVTTASELASFLTDLSTGNFGAAFTALEQLIFGSATTAAINTAISSTAVVNTTQNLQGTTSTFPDVASVQELGQWSWDGAIDHTQTAGSGSALAVANGQSNVLLGVPGAVQPGQVVTPQGFVTWSGLTAAGGTSPIQVQLIPWSGTLTPGTPGTPVTPTGCSITSPGASSSTFSGAAVVDGVSWVELTGTYTVPSSGVGFVQLALVVTAAATAGNVNFDDCTDDVAGGFLADLENDITNIIDSFSPGGTSAEFLAGVTGFLGFFGVAPATVASLDVTSFWTFVIDDIINPLNAIETAAENIVGTLAQDAVTGLTDLADAAVNAWDSLFGITPTSSSTPVKAGAVPASSLPNVTIGGVSDTIENHIQAGVDAVANSLGVSTTTGNPTTAITTGLTAIPATNVVGGTGATVTFGAAGAGAYSTNSGESGSTSWSHTIATTDLGVVAATAFKTSSSASFTSSVTYGGVAMTLLGTAESDADPDGGAAFLQLWWLKSPPSGSKTVEFSVTNSEGNSVFLLAGESLSYSASAIGTAVTAFGSGTSLSVSDSSETGHMVVAAMVALSGSVSVDETLSSFSQTSRFSHTGLQLGTSQPAIVMGDAAGASSVAFAATSSTSAVWAAIAVDLSN